MLNRTPPAEIAASYQFSEREVLRHFIKLDRLKVIELQPGNHVRLLVNRHFSWRAGGPVQRHIHDKLLREFTSSHFIADVIERDRGPQSDRHGAAFVLALRRWNYSGFMHFRRT